MRGLHFFGDLLLISNTRVLLGSSLLTGAVDDTAGAGVAVEQL